MPLAPAHPAVVLPLQRLGLPLSALVAGAVAPDAPVYLPVPVSYETTHSGRGLVADVAIGLGLLWLWSTLVRDAVVDLTPFLRRRVPARAQLTRAAWLPAVVAVALSVLVTAVGLARSRRAGSRDAFLAALVVAALSVGLLVARGAVLVPA